MKITTTLFFFFIASLALAQSNFVRSFGNVQGDFGTSCVETFDNGIVVSIASSTNSFNVMTSVIKTNANGELMWTKNKQIGLYSYPQTILQSSDSGIVVFGNANYTPTLNGNDYFLFVLKMDSAGNDIWSKEIRMSVNDLPVKLIRSNYGGYILCSVYDFNIGTYPSASVIRMDDDGNIRWSKKMDLPYGFTPTSIVESINGNICVAGRSVGFSPVFFNDIGVIYLDSLGNQIWSRVLQTYYDDDCNLVMTNSSGDIFLSGRTYSVPREWDMFLIKLNSSGNVVSEYMYDAGTNNGEIVRTGIAFDDGGVLLLGDIGTFDERDIVMLRINQTGDIRWSRKYPFSSMFTNYPYDVIQTFDGSFLYTGDVRPPAYYRDAALVKTTSSGYVSCYTDTLIFSRYSEPFKVITPFPVISAISLSAVDSLVNEPANMITEKVICEQIFPVPDFTFVEDTICSSQCVNFIDKTLNQPYSWSWTFIGADSTVSFVQNPTGICFQSKGNFKVRLSATNSAGTMSIEKEISVGEECPDVPFIIPNVFTPDGDGKNDVFEIKNLPVAANLSIYNRWGASMFKSTKDQKFWTGYNDKGIKASDGVYFYVLTVNGEFYKGSFQLIGSN